VTVLSTAALRLSATLPLGDDVIGSCLLDSPTDALFESAWRLGLDTVPRQQRCGALGGVTGHIAESVVELVLAEEGCDIVWHFTGPGRHGVDLLVLTPAGQMVAVEVKGTLRSGRWPRLSRRELTQMSAAWIDNRDNPGMAKWDLRSDDVYGMVAAVNFPDQALRVAVTADFECLHPLSALEDFLDLSWLNSSQGREWQSPPPSAGVDLAAPRRPASGPSSS
jgi:hypothetical protein